MIHEEENKEPLPGAEDAQPPPPLNPPSTEESVVSTEPIPETEQPPTTN